MNLKAIRKCMDEGEAVKVWAAKVEKALVNIAKEPPSLHPRLYLNNLYSYASNLPDDSLCDALCTPQMIQEFVDACLKRLAAYTAGYEDRIKKMMQEALDVDEIGK